MPHVTDQGALSPSIGDMLCPKTHAQYGLVRGPFLRVVEVPSPTQARAEDGALYDVRWHAPEGVWLRAG